MNHRAGETRSFFIPTSAAPWRGARGLTLIGAFGLERGVARSNPLSTFLRTSVDPHLERFLRFAARLDRLRDPALVRLAPYREEAKRRVITELAEAASSLEYAVS